MGRDLIRNLRAIAEIVAMSCLGVLMVMAGMVATCFLIALPVLSITSAIALVAWVFGKAIGTW